MARIRTIKPEFFTSEDIVCMTPLARLFYVSLWCEADREGRLEWKPRTFKLRYLPGDNCDIESLANELIENELIILYEVDGKLYAEIPSFKKHQVINNRESESRIPARVVDASGTRESDVPGEGKGREGKGINTLSGEPDPAPESRATVQAKEAIGYLNQKTNSGFQLVDSNLRLVKARIEEGFSLDVVKAVIDRQVSKWGDDPKMAEYLRPKTLFAASNFASYAGQVQTSQDSWWLRAGFETAFDAENHGCNANTAHEWQDGKRVGVTA